VLLPACCAAGGNVAKVAATAATADVQLAWPERLLLSDPKSSVISIPSTSDQLQICRRTQSSSCSVERNAVCATRGGVAALAHPTCGVSRVYRG
jgi:hypothetical protein